ncbi:MAG TPA: hypothetical protein VMH39_08645 [Gemmatimonadaceae bacterium]|nr:hypothetical protein [Gemmatimonadaceae bacterium]
MTSRGAGPTAALAGIPAGLQAQGIWAGRRQLFIRFAAEAETATMYSAAALATEISKAKSRSSFHSISIAGRDPLANTDYIRAAFNGASETLPTMLDCDGQRPEAIGELKPVLTLMQVTIEGPALADPVRVDGAVRSIRAAADAGLQHALVLGPDERTSDAVLLRIVEQAHGVGPATMIVVHPAAGSAVDRDRRWTSLIERSAAVHHDVRLAIRIPAPTGMR